MRIRENKDFVTIKSGALKVVLCDVGASIYDIKFGSQHMVSNYFNKKVWRDAKDVYYGKTVGRICGRVKDCKLLFNGKTYMMNQNDGVNSLHGGVDGISTKVFERKITANPGSIEVKYTYLSKDNEQGYPGNVELIIVYTIKEDNSITIDFDSKSDVDTPIDLTNHCYYKLGNGKNIMDHVLKGNIEGFFAARGDTTVDISKVLKVENADFSKGVKVGDIINSNYFSSFFQKGIDHCFVFAKSKENKIELSYKKFSLEISTDYPCFQIYSENYPKKVRMNDLRMNQLHGSMAIEPQEIPVDFDKMVSKANEIKHRTMTIKFTKGE